MGHVRLPPGCCGGPCVHLASTWDRHRPCGAAGQPPSGMRGAGSVLTRNFLRRRLGRAGGEGTAPLRTGPGPPRSPRNELR